MAKAKGYEPKQGAITVGAWDGPNEIPKELFGQAYVLVSGTNVTFEFEGRETAIAFYKWLLYGVTPADELS